MIKKKKVKIISGFPGIGKTHYKHVTTLNVSDSDSSLYSWLDMDKTERNSNFPQNYMEHIKHIQREYDIIFVSSHKVVREALIKNNILFILVYPTRELKYEYLERFQQRNDSRQFVDLLCKEWDRWINEMENQEGCDKIILKSNQYLYDVI